MQKDLFGRSVLPKVNDKLSGTFQKNMSLPIHRWFRYSAGFSAEWVKSILEERDDKELFVIDPFAGSGTVQLECDFKNIPSIGLDPHPFASKIAKAKLNWRIDTTLLRITALEVLENAVNFREIDVEYPKLIIECYSEEKLIELHSLKRSFENYNFNSEPIKSMVWLLLVSIIRPSSKAGTAQWQYVLPKKQKKKVLNPYEAFELKLNAMIEDMEFMAKECETVSSSDVYMEDAREIESIPDNWGNMVITSPPYANNYDYADAARLELTFLEEIDGWKDLHEKVRKDLIVSCTQHAVKLGIRDKAYEILDDPLLEPIKDDLTTIYENLTEARKHHGGKKNYNIMAISYFRDLAKILSQLRDKCQLNDTEMCWVVGDSAPYSVYLPVDDFIGRLALNVGFTDYRFEKIRDRNTKWKNRKHRVPLKEGRLWING